MEEQLGAGTSTCAPCYCKNLYMRLLRYKKRSCFGRESSTLVLELALGLASVSPLQSRGTGHSSARHEQRNLEGGSNKSDDDTAESTNEKHTHGGQDEIPHERPKILITGTIPTFVVWLHLRSVPKKTDKQNRIVPHNSGKSRLGCHMTLSCFSRNYRPILRCRHDSFLPWRCAGRDLQPQSHQRRTLPLCRRLLPPHRKWLAPLRTRPSRTLLCTNWRERGARGAAFREGSRSGVQAWRRKKVFRLAEKRIKSERGHIGL